MTISSAAKRYHATGREIPTDEFRIGRPVAEVDSRDVEHVAQVDVGVAGLVRVDVVTFPLLPRQLQRYRLDRHDLTWRHSHACVSQTRREPCGEKFNFEYTVINLMVL